MPWAKLDDRFYLNPKIMRAGLVPRALYIAGLVHAAGGLTDGLIEHSAIPRLAALADVVKWRTAAARLVELGLWKEVAEGYLIHDYLAYNPSKEHAEHVRQERAKAGKMGGRPPKSPVEEKQPESKLVSHEKTPVPSRPVLIPLANTESGVDSDSPSSPNGDGPRDVTNTVVLNGHAKHWSQTPEGKEWIIASFQQRFWPAYPRKTHRAEALKAWQRVMARAPTFEDALALATRILEVLHEQKKHWTDPAFTPHAGTYLNAERWTDEIIIPTARARGPGRR